MLLAVTGLYAESEDTFPNQEDSFYCNQFLSKA